MFATIPTQAFAEAITSNDVNLSDTGIAVTPEIIITDDVVDAENVIAENTAPLNFLDVNENDWFYENVQYAVNYGLFAGINETKFDPYGSMTRAMYVTVLSRMAGIDGSLYGGDSGFFDVEQGHWSAPSILWANQYGITSGTGDGKFSPNLQITREQMATLTVRFFELYDIAFPEKIRDDFPADYDTISEYAKESVLKLWQSGLLFGTPDGNFNPKQQATRAEAAAFFARTNEIVVQWRLDSQQNSETNPLQTTVTTTINRNTSSSTGGSSTGGSSTGGSLVSAYTIRFETNGGSAIADIAMSAGSLLNDLPSPHKNEFIFMGWYYDVNFETFVSENDVISSDLTLYAKYDEALDLQEIDTPIFVTYLDATKDFTIELKTSVSMSIEELKKVVTFKNASIQSDENSFVIADKGDGKNFIVSGQHTDVNGNLVTGFEEGNTYKITIEDEKVSFTNEEDSVIIYDFTIRKDEIVNASLRSDITNIPLAQISELIVNGERIDTIHIPVITVGADGSQTEQGAETVGSFTYSNAPLSVGDTVCIYEGASVPDLEEFDSEESTAFVTITAENGNGNYTYKGAETKEVLFMPDVFPIKDTFDIDEDNSNFSITVLENNMDFTANEYYELGFLFDEQTKIDVGDFLAFYSGNLSDANAISYGEITNVIFSDGTYVIGYDAVTLEELQVAIMMEVNKTETIKGDELLAGVDIAAIEQAIELQAVNSGFIEEAAAYLASVALETNTFKELNETMNLTAYSMSEASANNIATLSYEGRAIADTKVEVTKKDVKINTDLKHFDVNNGIRVTLELGIKITVTSGDNKIEIEIDSFFEQEVKVDIGVNASADITWKFIIPIIEEYNVIVTTDFYNFTGISIDATVRTFENSSDKENENENEAVKIVTEDSDDDDSLLGQIVSIGEEIKKLLEEDDKSLEGIGMDGLNTKYEEMLNAETALLDLYEQKIVSTQFSVLMIIAITIDVYFVVALEASLSLGAELTYENAKRYIYTVEVFKMNMTNETINLSDEKFSFEFYVMGRMHLKVGIKVDIMIGLVSTKIAGVGFDIETGAYIKFYGYFYYKYEKIENLSPNTYFTGAMLFEFGIYLDIGFIAEVLNGQYGTYPTIYENEWPLWTAGTQKAVQDFSYESEDAPEVTLRGSIISTTLPDTTFEMQYLDLKEGLDDDGNLQTETFSDETDFIIEMTLDMFSYDPTTNKVSITVPADVLANTEYEAEMKITWIGQPLVFTSVPIQRTIPLYWTNMENGFFISFDSNGGSYVPMIFDEYEAEIESPEDPTREGYDFGGWYDDTDLTIPYTVPETMPKENKEVFAKWIPRDDTKYTIYHQKQEVNGGYILAETDHLEGTTDSEIAPSVKNWEGYQSPESRTLVIKSDGSSELTYYYPVNTYIVTFVSEYNDDIVMKYKYGQNITVPAVLSAKGYEFIDWGEGGVAETMPAYDLWYTARWEDSASTPYRIDYYQENANDTDYTIVLKDTINGTGRIGSTVTATDLAYEHFTLKDSLPSNIITQDGSLVLQVYYTRDEFTLTYNKNGSDASFVSGTNETPTYKHGANLIVLDGDAVGRSGYGFAGWYTDSACTIPFTNVMPTSDITVYAKWNQGEVNYKVEHLQENANDNEYTTYEIESFTATSDTDVTPTVKTYEGFTSPATQTVTVDASGSTIVQYKYDRNVYDINFMRTFASGSSAINSSDSTQSTLAVAISNGEIEIKNVAFTEMLTEGKLKYGASIVEPEIESEYYTWNFLVSPPSTMPSGNALYTLELAYKTYDLVLHSNYDGNYETQTMASQKVDTSLTLPTPSFTANRVSHTFQGWATESTATIAEYESGATVKFLPTDLVDSKVNLYAVWKPVMYEITYDYNMVNVTVQSDQPTEYSAESEEIVLSEPVKLGYTFLNWVDADGKQVTNIIPKGSTGDKYYKAIWSSEVDIATADQLMQLSEDILTGEYESQDMVYTLKNDIDMTSKTFTPIGSETYPFKGTFDGNNKVVENVKIASSNTNNIGFFGYTEGAIIKKLGLIDCDIEGKTNVGGLIGLMDDGSQVENCFVENGSVTGVGSVGGLIGHLYGSTAREFVNVNSCYTTTTVEATGTIIGGLIGTVGRNKQISNCYTTGSVTGTNFVGGLFGFVERYSSDTNPSIKYCYTTASVSATEGQYGSGISGCGGDLYYCVTMTQSITYVTSEVLVATDDVVYGRDTKMKSECYYLSNSSSASSAFAIDDGQLTKNFGVAGELFDGADTTIWSFGDNTIPILRNITSGNQSSAIPSTLWANTNSLLSMEASFEDIDDLDFEKDSNENANEDSDEILTFALQGQITNSIGEHLPNVVVKLTKNQESVFETMSSADGIYEFLEVPIGVYSLEIQSENYHADYINEIDFFEAMSIDIVLLDLDIETEEETEKEIEVKAETDI